MALKQPETTSAPNKNLQVQLDPADSQQVTAASGLNSGRGMTETPDTPATRVGYNHH